jgi:hypothetical protein
MARLVPQLGQNMSSHGESAGTAARIVGDHSMSPAASWSFQRSTTALASDARLYHRRRAWYRQYGGVSGYGLRIASTIVPIEGLAAKTTIKSIHRHVKTST